MAHFDAAFTLLERAVEVDKGPSPDPALAISLYSQSTIAFTSILSTSDSLSPESRTLILDNINKNNARVAALSNSPATATPITVTDAVLINEFDVCPDMPIAELVKPRNSTPSAPPQPEPLQHDAETSVRQQHDAETSVRQRSLDATAANYLTAALTADESLQASPSPALITAVSDAYIAAAGAYLSSLKLLESTPPVSQASVTATRTRVAEILDRAEQLKGNNVAIPQPRASPSRSAPPSPTSLTPTEIATLKSSSVIGKKTFMPFLASDVQSITQFTTLGAEPFDDPDGLLALSDSQKAHFYKFARPDEIARHQRKSPPCIYKTISPYTIKQSLVTDCSFIASLCIAASYETRFRRRLVTGILYPQNHQGCPLYNECGKYIVKLYLNGVARKVTIDDRLPVDRNYNLLCSHTSSATHLELWVSLLEKAFLKLTGAMSYAFPGSNSGVDLYSLTGWVPERLFFKSDDSAADYTTTPERIWSRLHSANSYGDCLTTASVGKEISEREAEDVGLVTQHAYGILDVKELKGGKRFIFMKNPWASKGWKGRFSTNSPAWTPEIGKLLQFDYVKARQCSDDGLFWITWEDFRHYFSSVHLSWQPSLFNYKYTTHAPWLKADGPANDKYNVESNPQFLLAPSKESFQKRSTFYVLITRHVDIKEQQGAEVNDFIACFLYSNKDRNRIIYPSENVIYSGVYTSNQHILLTFDADPKYPALNLVLRQYKKARDLTYSVSIYSTSNFGISMAPAVPRENVMSLQGAWSGAGSGGASGRSRLFHTNPQYRIEVAEDTDMRVVLQSSPKLSVSVSVCKGDARLEYISSSCEAISSEDYRPALSTCSGVLKKGVYVCVVSTWVAGETGAYALEFRGAAAAKGKIKVSKLKTEEEMFSKNYKLEGVWDVENGVGCANYGRYNENMLYKFVSKSNGEMNARLSVLGIGKMQSDAEISLNVTVFELTEGQLRGRASSVGKNCGLVASSNDGVYSAGSAGVRLACNVVTGKEYGFVVSTFEPIEGPRFQLAVYSSCVLSFS